MNRISIFSLEKRFVKFEKAAKSAVFSTLKFLGEKKSFIEVYLINDKEIFRLNSEFRHKNKATNVLSFEAPKEFPYPASAGSDYLGEIFLAPDYISKEGSDLRRLATHGALHLLGYDHKGKSDKIKMEKVEGEIAKFLE